MELKRFICETCFGEVVQKDDSFVCLSCGNKYQKGNNLTDEIVNELNNANQRRKLFYFDEALELYDDILNANKNVVEASFGALLSEYGIEYVKDYDGSYKPTCHRLNEVPVNKSRYYDNLTSEYKLKADKIEQVRLEVFNKSKEIEPYDVFICYKKTSLKDNTRETIESKWAEDIYNFLTYRAKLRVFYAEKSLSKSNVDYEPHIYAALRSAKIMLVLTTDLEHLQAPWVQNEWRRFASYIRNGEDKVIRVITDKNKVEPNKLPRELKLKQVIDHELSSWDEEVIDACNKVCNKLITIERREYGNIKYAKKKSLTQTIEKRVFENIEFKQVTASETAKLSLIKQFLEMGEFNKVDQRCHELLADNKSCAEAYWYLLLCENKVKNSDELIRLNTKIESTQYFDALLACSTKDEIEKYLYILERKILLNPIIDDVNLLVTLPSNCISEQRINHICDKLFDICLNKKSDKLFNLIIKLEKNPDNYIKKNLLYGNKYGKLDCYKRILDVDEGNIEALAKLYLLKNNADHIVSLNDLTELEDLYKYGFNSIVNERIFNICSSANNLTNNHFKLFDFVIKMLPKEKNELFISYLNVFVDKLIKSDLFDQADKYLTILLQENKYDHNAHFKKVLVNNKVKSCEYLIPHIEEILDNDPSFANAMDSYAEKYPTKVNIYMNFYKNSKLLLSELNKYGDKNAIIFDVYILGKNDFKYKSKSYNFSQFRNKIAKFDKSILFEENFDTRKYLVAIGDCDLYIKKIIDEEKKKVDTYTTPKSPVTSNTYSTESHKIPFLFSNTDKKPKKKNVISIILKILLSLVCVILTTFVYCFNITSSPYNFLDILATLVLPFIILTNACYLITSFTKTDEFNINTIEQLIESGIRICLFAIITMIKEGFSLSVLWVIVIYVVIDFVSYSIYKSLSNHDTYKSSLKPYFIVVIICCSIGSFFVDYPSRFEYTYEIQSDNTIRLRASSLLNDKDEIIIPNNYDNHLVTALDYDGFNTYKNFYFDDTNVNKISFEDNCSIKTLKGIYCINVDNVDSIYIPESVQNVDTFAIKCDTGTVYCGSKEKPKNLAVRWGDGPIPTYWGVNKDDIIELSGMQFLIVDGEAILTGYYGESSSVEIPSQIPFNMMKYKVTKIGYGAFRHSYSLEEVVIPDSVTVIEKNSFMNCFSLKKVIIPSSVKIIGNNAFAYCGKLEDIVLPIGVENIGSSAFANCNSIKTFILPEGLVSIGEYAFDLCDSLRFVYIPNSVKNVGKYLMNGGHTIFACETKEIPSGWDSKWYGFKTYYLGINYNQLVFNDNELYFIVDGKAHYVVYLGDKGDVIIPNTINFNGIDYVVDKINYRAFYYNEIINEVTLPNSIIQIDSEAFYTCNKLRKINIPQSVTIMGENIFKGCDSITIYSEVNYAPEGWKSNWNPDNKKVIWGYKS